MLVLAGTLAVSAVGEGETLGPVGGPGGVTQSSTCAFGPREMVCDGPTCQSSFTQVLVGAEIHAGAWLDRIRGLCVDVARDGSWRSALEDAEGAVGSPGGQPVQRVCPRNFAVVGMSGRAGWYVDRLRIACRRLTSQIAVAGDVHWLPPVGGDGGQPFGPLRCIGRPVYELFGKGRVYVDSLRMFCR